jgi:hypothetical protein
MDDNFHNKDNNKGLEYKLYDSGDIIPIYGGCKFYQRLKELPEELKDNAKFKAYSVANGVYHGLASVKAVYLLSSILDNL